MEGDVCDAEVEKEDEDEDRDCDKRVGICGWEDDFEEGVEGVEAVLGDLKLSLSVPDISMNCMACASPRNVGLRSRA